MLRPLLELYNLIESNKTLFEAHNLSGDFFIDTYRSQPQEPEQYEYFSLPAIFVDYTMQGQGRNQPRLVTMILHIVTDEMPDASNKSPQKKDGLNCLLYNLLLQQILEGSKLGNTKALQFISENPVDEAVANYHMQSYEFEAYLSDMADDVECVLGEFERLNIYGKLRNRKPLK